MIYEELNTASKDIMGTIEAILAKPSNKIIALGEMHYSPDRTRLTFQNVVESAAKHGFTHLALELRNTLQPTFEQFQKTGELDNLVSSLKGNGADKWFRPVGSDFEGRPDLDIFGMVSKAQKNNMTIIAVDESPEDGRYSDRDGKMAARVSEVLKDQNHKVILWGGYTHHYARPIGLRTGWKSAVEHLSEQHANSILSIAGITCEHGLSLVEFDYVSDASGILEPISRLDDSHIVETKNAANLALTEAGKIERCGNGKHHGANCQCGSNKPTSNQSPILWGYWDYLIVQNRGFRPEWSL
ncbi:hypothetical protein KBF38_23735 [bacterium]|nr:hypothetical protein [bacterium]